MKTSLKKRIISIAAAAVMAVSTAAVSMASASAATVETQAVSYNQQIKIKVNVSNEWRQHSPAIGAYFYNENGGEAKWEMVSQSGYMGSYVSTYGDFTHVIFVRFPVHTEFTWANAWNKTGDLRISDLNGTYTIQGWEQSVN